MDTNITTQTKRKPAIKQASYSMESSSVLTTSTEFSMSTVTAALAFMLGSALAYAVALTWDATITQFFSLIHLPPSSSSLIKSLLITLVAVIATIFINRYLVSMQESSSSPST